MKSYYPKTLKRVNGYLRYLLDYFDQVIHPASGRSNVPAAKSYQASKSAGKLQASPESFNLRGGNQKKQEKKKNAAP